MVKFEANGNKEIKGAEDVSLSTRVLPSDRGDRRSRKSAERPRSDERGEETKDSRGGAEGAQSEREEKGAVERETKLGLVYFVATECGRFIRIGYTDNPDIRFPQILVSARK